MTAWYLLLLVAYAIIPGIAVLVFVRFRYAHIADAIIACVWAGFSWTVFWVYVFLFGHLYYWISALAIIVVPMAYLCWSYWRKSPGNRLWPAGTGEFSTASFSTIDMVVVAGIAVLLGLYMVDAFTSPITGWDAVVSWDKWASDWANRNNLYGYLTGGYPQALPMFVSVVYKLTGAHAEPLSLAQYAAHALHPLIGVCLLLALIRLAFYFRVPIWIVVLFTFSNHVLRERIANGDVDLLLTTLVASSTVIYVAYRDGYWTSRFGVTVILGSLLFATLNTKATGFISILVVLSLYLARGSTRKQTSTQALPAADLKSEIGASKSDKAQKRTAEQGSSPEPDEALRKVAPSWRSMAATMVIPLLLTGVFYGHQAALAAHISPQTLNPHEMDIDPLTQTARLKSVVQAGYIQPGIAARLVQSFSKVEQSFEIRPEFETPLAGLFTISLAACIAVTSVSPLLAPTIITYLIWFHWASYDLRNFLPILPLLGVCSAAGYAYLSKILGKRVLVRSVLALLVGIFTIEAGGRILADVTTLGHLFRGPDQAIRRRLSVMDAGVASKASLFFAEEFPTYDFLNSMRLTERANLVAVSGYMYRWFPNGGYLNTWVDRFQAGDLFVGSEGYGEPPDYEQWTLLQKARLRIWLFDQHPVQIPLGQVLLTGPTPPLLKRLTPGLLEAEPTGLYGLAMYNVADRAELGKGSVVVWRVVVEGKAADPAIIPRYEVYDPAVIDAARSRTAVDTSRINQGRIVYSGALVFSGKPVSPRWNDGILVGIACSKPAEKVLIRNMRIGVYK